VLLPVVGILLGFTAMIIPWLGQHTGYLQGFFAADPFATDALQAKVGWEIWQGAPGLLLIVASLAGLYFWLKNRIWLAAQTIFIGGAVFTELIMLLVICNIEGHSQRAAIEFYKSKSNEPCLIKPVGFKTYAHLYYACKQPASAADKTYFIAKVGKLEDMHYMPECRELYRKNGFVFFEQIPSVEKQR
jgi:hypothetical protein